MPVSDSFATPKATFTFLRAAEELGYKEIDLNGEEQIGNNLVKQYFTFIEYLELSRFGC